MASTTQDQNTHNNERLLSQTLFNKVKPLCIELSQIAVEQPFNPRKVVTLLISIENALKSHHEQYTGDESTSVYKLSPNIADYVFFPLSNLLKQPSLDDTIIQHLFGILAFLVNNAWSFNVNFTLIDQLFPLIIFLSGGDLKKEPSPIATKSLSFKLATVKTFQSLVDSLDRSYFQKSAERRLVLLSNTITITLAIITSSKPDSQESIKVILESLLVIAKLRNYLSNDQLSVILPGIVSALTKFTSLNCNLNYQIIIKMLRLLSGLIIASFNDKDLGAELNMDNRVGEISDIHLSWDDDTKTLDDNISLSDVTISEDDHRSMSWLKATSKQLKLSLMIFFKTVLFGSRNKQRLQTQEELVGEISRFVESILKNCFVSLHKEFASLLIDIYSILASVVSYNDNEVTDRIVTLSNLYVLTVDSQEDKEIALYEIVKTKLTDLVDNKFSTIIFTTDDEKISMNITAIEFNFSLLLELSRKVNPDFNDLDVLKQRCFTLLQEYMVDSFKFENSKVPKTSNKGQLVEPSSTLNQLDSIELPEFVNTKNIVKQDTANKDDRTSYIHNLKTIARDWNSNEIKHTQNDPLVGITSPLLEVSLRNFIQFLSNLKYNQNESARLNDLERILETSGDDISSKSVSLWVASSFARANLAKMGNFDPNDFLELEDDDMEVEGDHESSYLILSRAEELIDDISQIQQDSPLALSSLAYSSALMAIGAVAGTIPLDQFRSSFLMDYLLTMFQTLTYNDFPQIQLQAQATVKIILDTYYDGSIVNLISDNLDYLIDNVSLQLSVASNLTPTLPGIMLIIIKVAGIQLLESNQLHDVLTDMFVILDSYHGYNKIVESFFIVFESLIDQIRQAYDCSPKIEDQVDNSVNNSPYKPWGMTKKEQLLALIDTSNKIIDEIEEYDRNNEYFKRKEDLPFSELDKDSDDEEELDEEGQQKEEDDGEKEEPWTSPIPKDTYAILKRIFNYGFILVSQPSYSLKGQIIKTLRSIFPLLCTNYKDILPILASNWQILVTLITGSKSLSTSILSNQQYTSEEITIMTQSFQFITEILNEDRKRNDFFFNRKFQDAWEFMSKHTQLIAPSKPHSVNSLEKQLVVSERAVYAFRMHPMLKNAMITFLITGVQNYERMIPDLLRYEIIKVCYGLKIPAEVKISRDTQGVIEVLQTAH